MRKFSLINQEHHSNLFYLLIDGVSLLDEEVHDKFSQIFFEAIFDEDSTDLCIDCVDVQ